MWNGNSCYDTIFEFLGRNDPVERLWLYTFSWNSNNNKVIKENVLGVSPFRKIKLRFYNEKYQNHLNSQQKSYIVFVYI